MSIETHHERSPAAALAAAVHSLGYRDLPAQAIRLAERCFLDTVGVSLAGAAAPPTRIARSVLDRSGATDGPASIIGHSTTASLTDAAFVNGTAGHAIDFDDVSPAMSGHPSVPMVAPLLAVGEAENADGKAVLTAFVAGFETQAALADPLLPGHYEAGWHATATFGTFGTAAAVANLLGLDETKTSHALNIAASMPAGLVKNFGSMTKPMHVGHAARSGLTAALLAAEGFTADANAIGGDRGFFDLYAGPNGPRDWTPLADDRPLAFLDDGIHVKKYPCCYFTHASIAAAEELKAEHDVAPEDIDAVRVTAAPGAGDVLAHHDPATGLEGKFSMEYTVAAALAHGRVGLDAFEDDAVSDPTVQRIRERVTFEPDPDRPYEWFGGSVSITLTDGRTVSTTRDGPPGTHTNPLSDAELHDKFDMCAQRTLPDDAVRTARETLDSLREHTIPDVTATLTA